MGATLVGGRWEPGFLGEGKGVITGQSPSIGYYSQILTAYLEASFVTEVNTRLETVEIEE